MAPVVVGEDPGHGQADPDGGDDEEDLGQVGGGLPDGDIGVHGPVVEGGDRPVEGHAGDHDDDGGHRQGHARQRGARDEQLREHADGHGGQAHGELPGHVELVDEDEPPGVGQRAHDGGQRRRLRTGVEEHGEAVGGDEGAQAAQDVQDPARGDGDVGRLDLPVEQEGHGPHGHARRGHDHEHVGRPRQGAGEVLAHQVEHGGDHGEPGDQEEDRGDDPALVVALDEARGPEQAHNAHVDARRDDAADQPGEEVLVAPHEHLPAHRLPDEGGDEHRQALDPAALVQEAESRAGDAGGGRIEEGPVEPLHARHLVELGLEVLHGLVGAQVVDDAAQGLQAGDVDAAPAHLRRLGAEPVPHVGGGHDLGHGDGGLVTVEADGGGGPRHGGLHPVGAGARGEHETAQAQDDGGLEHEAIRVELEPRRVIRNCGITHGSMVADRPSPPWAKAPGPRVVLGTSPPAGAGPSD